MADRDIRGQPPAEAPARIERMRCLIPSNTCQPPMRARSSGLVSFSHSSAKHDWIQDAFVRTPVECRDCTDNARRNRNIVADCPSTWLKPIPIAKFVTIMPQLTFSKNVRREALGKLHKWGRFVTGHRCIADTTLSWAVRARILPNSPSALRPA